MEYVRPAASILIRVVGDLPPVAARNRVPYLVQEDFSVDAGGELNFGGSPMQSARNPPRPLPTIQAQTQAGHGVSSPWPA